MHRRSFLAALAVTTAGCAGWGEDGPAETEPENETDANETSETNETDEDEPEKNESNDTADESEDEPEDERKDTDADATDDPEPEPEEPEPEPENEPDGTDEPDEPDEPEETHILIVHTGEAIGAPDIPITIEGDGTGIKKTETTNSEGIAYFELPNGEYTVTGTDKNDRTESETVVIDGADEEVRLYSLAPPIPDTHMLTVEVVDAETGEPIEGATVSGVGGYHPDTGDMMFEVVTGPDGAATTEVYESWYATSVTADGYEPQNPGINVESDTTERFALQPKQEGARTPSRNPRMKRTNRTKPRTH